MDDREIPNPVESRDKPVDEVRRKLLKSTAVLGGALAAGQLPYSSPSIKSFFGTRSAWAQPSVTTAPVVSVTQPVSSPIVIVLGGPPLNQTNGASGSEVPTEFTDETFTVKNVGTVAVEFRTPTITGPDAAAFSIIGAALNGSPSMAPIPMQPGDTVEVTFRFSCGTTPEGVAANATIVLDIVPLEAAGPVEGVEDVPVVGLCGTLSCAIECPTSERESACYDSEGGIVVEVFPDPTPVEFFVRNTGSLALSITSVALQPTGSDVALTPMTGVIQPGEALTQSVTAVCDPQTQGELPPPPPGYAIVAEGQSVDLVDGAPAPVVCDGGTVRVLCAPP